MQKRRVLVLDIGGTSVKLHIAGMEEPLRVPSGRKMTPERMISEIQKAAASGRPEFDAISVGIPAPVVRGKVLREPANLGPG